jgi:hypothetical protein
MRVSRGLLLVLAVAVVASAGCAYKRPNIEGRFAKTQVGMTKDEVIDILGRSPTVATDTDLMYQYDDPLRPVRLWYVLDEKGVVVEKYLENRKELTRRADENAGKAPPTQQISVEEKENRSYPGGPLPRFEKKYGVGGY